MIIHEIFAMQTGVQHFQTMITSKETQPLYFYDCILQRADTHVNMGMSEDTYNKLTIVLNVSKVEVEQEE
jgi:hypothetical protein